MKCTKVLLVHVGGKKNIRNFDKNATNKIKNLEDFWFDEIKNKRHAQFRVFEYVIASLYLVVLLVRLLQAAHQVQPLPVLPSLQRVQKDQELPRIQEVLLHQSYHQVPLLRADREVRQVHGIQVVQGLQMSQGLQALQFLLWDLVNK